MNREIFHRRNSCFTKIISSASKFYDNTETEDTDSIKRDILTFEYVDTNGLRLLNYMHIYVLYNIIHAYVFSKQVKAEHFFDLSEI